MDDFENQRLSQALGGMGQAGQMLHFASKLVKNKDAKTMLNLMSMSMGAASTTKDPMALMQATQGPMADIAMMTKEDQQKRLSQVMPQPKMRNIMPPVGSMPEEVSGPGYSGPAYNEEEIRRARTEEAIRKALMAPSSELSAPGAGLRMMR